MALSNPGSQGFVHAGVSTVTLAVLEDFIVLVLDFFHGEFIATVASIVLVAIDGLVAIAIAIASVEESRFQGRPARNTSASTSTSTTSSSTRSLKGTHADHGIYCFGKRGAGASSSSSIRL